MNYSTFRSVVSVNKICRQFNDFYLRICRCYKSSGCITLQWCHMNFKSSANRSDAHKGSVITKTFSCHGVIISSLTLLLITALMIWKIRLKCPILIIINNNNTSLWRCPYLSHCLSIPISLINTLDLLICWAKSLNSYGSCNFGCSICCSIWTNLSFSYRLVGDLTRAKWVHDDVIKWKYFPHYWPFVCGIHRSPVNSPHKGQWRGALMFSSICAWINVE